MPYNKEIEARVERIVTYWKGASRKGMFGGICHLLNGNMFCGVYRDFLILRLGEKGAREALASDHVRPFAITGKPLRGWVMVEQEGFKDDEVLEEWLNEAKEFAETLPAKHQGV